MGETARPRPISPDECRRLLYEGPFPVGEARALAVLGVDRSTLSRWLSGASRVPHAAAVLLRQLAEGIPPGGSDHWTGFRWEGDALVTPAGEYVTARRIEALTWQVQHVQALQREIARLESEIEGMRRLGGSANDATVRPPRPVVSGGA